MPVERLEENNVKNENERKKGISERIPNQQETGQQDRWRGDRAERACEVCESY